MTNFLRNFFSYKANLAPKRQSGVKCIHRAAGKGPLVPTQAPIPGLEAPPRQAGREPLQPRRLRGRRLPAPLFPEPDTAEPQLRAQVTVSLVFCLHITGTTRQ